MKSILLLFVIMLSSFCVNAQDETAVYLDGFAGGEMLQDIESIKYIEPTDSSSVLQSSTSFETQLEVSAAQFDYKKTPEWRKYKILRAVGWSVFGAGCVTTYIGLGLMEINGIEGGNFEPSSIITLSTGVGAILGGLGVLSWAYKCRKKAKETRLQVGMTQLASPEVGQRISCTPAISLALTF